MPLDYDSTVINTISEEKTNQVDAIRNRKSSHPLIFNAVLLLLIWLPLSIYLGSQRFPFDLKLSEQAAPIRLSLNNSYERWACCLGFSDAQSYIKAGLGFADGHGIYSKRLSGEKGPDYDPYTIQGPGTPFTIGTIAKLFGYQHVLPYLILIIALHYAVALVVMVLAKPYIEYSPFLFMSGLLSLLCYPALNSIYSTYLFMSEPLTGIFLVTSLLALQHLWQSLKQHRPLEKQLQKAILFGTLMAATSYFRDIYTSFFVFICFALLLAASIKRNILKATLLSLLIASTTFFLVQYPWRERNQHISGYFAMSFSSYYGVGMWRSIWSDYKQFEIYRPGLCGLGIGDYLDHARSEQLVSAIDQNPALGSIKAMKALIRAVVHHPRKAFFFKLRDYNYLWLGLSDDIFNISWCSISLASLFVFLFLTRKEFFPEIVCLPTFLFLISLVIHYEHRFTQPVYWLITPITLAWFTEKMIKFCRIKLRPAVPSTAPGILNKTMG